MRLAALLLLALPALLPAQRPTPDALRAAAAYSAERTGHAVLVWHRDSLVFEQYANGWTATRPHYLASGTKSFTGLMAAAAVDDGLLAFDERVSATITEWRSEPRSARITVRQLLALTSGIDGEHVGREVATAADVVAMPAAYEPGTTFRYAQEPFQVFHELMRRKLAATGGPSPEAWLQQRLLAPLGVRVARWMRADDGTPSLAGGAFMTARDWGAVGRLLLARGSWNGRALVRQSTFAHLVAGSDALPAYGISLWLNAPLPAGSVGPDEFVPAEVGRAGGRARGAEAILPGGPRDLFMAAGAGFQRLYVIPSRELVVVRLGDNRGQARGPRARGRSFTDAEFLARLLGMPVAEEDAPSRRPRLRRGA